MTAVWVEEHYENSVLVVGHHEFSCKIDSSTPESWARTWLSQAEEYIDIGDWILRGSSVAQPGEIYDIQNFLADHCGGDLPWSDAKRYGEVGRSKVLAAITASPDLDRINAKFQDRYGCWLWEQSWTEEDKSCERDPLRPLQRGLGGSSKNLMQNLLNGSRGASIVKAAEEAGRLIK